MSRIIDYTEASSAASDDYLLLDGSTNGTRKIKPSGFVDPTLTQPGQAADAKKTGDEIGALKEELTETGEALIYNFGSLSTDDPVDLFSKSDTDFQANHGYSGTTGTIAESTNNNISGYIPVIKGETLTVFYTNNGVRLNFLSGSISATRKIAFYNSAKTWERTASDFSAYSSGVLVIQNNGYIRFQYNGTSSAFLEIYKNSVTMIDGEKVKNVLTFNKLLTGDIINWLDSASDDYLVGYGFSGNTSTIAENAQYSISNYVRVYKGKKISIPYDNGTSFFTSTASSNVRKIAYYDENKTWVKAISFNSSSIPFSSDEVDLEHNGYIRIQFLNIYTPSAITIEGFKEIGGEFLGKGGSNPKWYAIGDSITDGRYSYFNGATPVTGTDHTAYYGYLAGKYLHMDVIEHGYGGMGYLTAASDTTTLIDVMNLTFDNPTLITVCLGINDVGTTPGDENSTALDGTWSGAVRNACEVLGAKYPKAQIVFMSPINANNRGTQDTAWSRKASVQNNLDAQRNILKHWCDVYNYKFIDMTVECPINVFNIVSLFPDKLHPSKTAHKMIGRWLSGALPFRNT